MKRYKAIKIIALVFIGLAVAVPDTFAQVLNTKNYSAMFLNNSGQLAVKYVLASSDKEYGATVAKLSGNETIIDTPLEIALLSYSAGVVNIRPVEADAILSAGNPRLAGLKLGAATYKELVELRFLTPNNTAAIGRYEDMLRFICDKNGVTRAEVEAFYRDNIRGLIADIVNEEFNKIGSFVLGTNGGGCNATLIRRQGQFILECEGYWGEPGAEYSDKGVRGKKDFTGTTLEQLITTMQRSGFFSSDGYNTVKTQAALIPAVVLSNTALTEITNIIARFYTEQNQSTYTAVLEAYDVIGQVLVTTRNIKYSYISASYERSLSLLNRDFAQKVFADVKTVNSITMLTREQQQKLIQLK